MNSFRRVLSITLIICMTAVIAAGCARDNNVPPDQNDGDGAQQTPDGDEKRTVKYWYPWGGDSETWDLWRVSEFEKKYPQFKFESTYVPEGAGISNGKLAAAVNSGDVPDIVVIDRPTEAYSYATQGGFEPLDDVLSQVGFDETEINQAIIPLMKYEDETYLIPQNTDTTDLFYRTDLFEEAGLDPNSPPKTMEELDTFAKALTKKDASGNVNTYGFIPWLDAGLDPPTWAWMFGANVFDPETNKVHLSTPEMIDNFKWQMGYADLYDPAVIKSAASSFGEAFSANHAFMTGKVAMTAMGNWFCNAIRIYAPELQYKIAPLPAPEGGRYGGCALNANVNACPKGARELEGAVLFSLFCQEPYIIDDNNKQWRSLGIYPDKIEDLTLMKEGDKYLPTIVDITFNENSGIFALTSASTFMNDKLRSGLEECIYNKADPAQVLSRIENEVQSQIDATS